MVSFDERIFDLIARTRTFAARGAAQMDAIAGLRYRAYRREGAIPENDDARFWDPVDAYPNTANVGVYLDDRLVAAIRLTVSMPGAPEIPTARVFPDILRPRSAAGERFLDPTRFVTDAEAARAHPDLARVTLRIPWMAMEHGLADTMLAAVRPEHCAFYRRLWGNTILAEPRVYPSLAKPVALTAFDFAATRSRILARHPWLASSDAERKGLFAPVWPRALDDRYRAVAV